MYLGPLTQIRRLPRPIQLLILGTFVNRIGSFILPYLTLVLKRDFALDAKTTAALVMGYGAGAVLATFLGGNLADRLGRRPTMILSLAGSGLTAVAMGLSGGLRSFLPLLIVFAFVADLYRPAVSAAMADWLAPADRAIGFAAIRMVANLGFAVGAGLGGLLADRSWRLLFIGDGLTSLAYAAIVLLLLAEPPHARPDDAATPAGAATSGPLRDPVALGAIAASFAFAIVFFSHVTVLPLAVAAAGYRASTYGGLLAVNGLLIALFEVSIVSLLGARRRLRVAAAGLALAGLGFALTGLVPHWAWFLFTVVAWTAGEILHSPQLTAFLADWAPPTARGRYMGALHSGWGLALFLNPLLFLPLQARLTPALFWPIMLAPTLPLAALLWRLDRHDQPAILRARHGGGPAPSPS